MAPSRGLSTISPLTRLLPKTYTCRQCRLRPLHSTPALASGHNRWSKIKHDKAKVDASKNRQRSIFAQEIALASKLFGPDPSLNTRLADLITKAKREGFAKTSIEAAVARGQGRSTSGATLESVTIEGILPGNVAVIVECETDNKLRTLADKKGRIVFEAREGVGVEEALEPALEAGAVDVEDDGDGRVVIFTEPGDTRAVGDALHKTLGLQIAASEILWEANEDTSIGVPDGNMAEELSTFVDVLQERETSLQAVAMNVAQGQLEEEPWKELQSRLSN
ncbi:hypothetical protein LTR91_014902 [Friedmanniomyces endolithicus]|uniref:Transcriptional regulatory protein n=1 Tax=Friedmanniomyces endolithicus TaxID=329885 RepID=A0AAN6KAV9_9PEZI|nr:hypothetical protein LTR35_015446 [Friedmanniomyces endolithicus]KAK0286537.1 hypothetical protein LTS00_010475 [Friedmanniomyces endolithicus]KAK0303474.1 hypothetical protein LTR01_008029 [Friedmanniomyces endolithicus]KAK0317165.1 hypothetical protein LTR82_011766 [Friedmanniomyces endolithicus]KAK0824119.1 hypothetical protein LTR73_007986 [Friedmanniomyces endolithicus]